MAWALLGTGLLLSHGSILLLPVLFGAMDLSLDVVPLALFVAMIGVGIMVVGMGWALYVVPYLDCSHGDCLDGWLSPAHYLRRIRSLLFLAPCLALALGAIYFVAGLWIADSWSFGFAEGLFATCFLAGLIMAGFHPRYYKLLKRKAIQEALRQQVCFACNYDLRGTEDTSPCPECGAPREGLPAD